MKAILVQEHAAATKDFLRLQGQYKEHVGLIRLVKAFLCNDSIVCQDTAADNRGSGLEMVTNHLRTIFAKMEDRLGVPGCTSAKAMLARYDAPSI
jgi:hypothetical protein